MHYYFSQTAILIVQSVKYENIKYMQDMTRGKRPLVS